MDEDPGSLKMEGEYYDRLGRNKNCDGDTVARRSEISLSLLWYKICREILENKEKIKRIVLLS